MLLRLLLTTIASALLLSCISPGLPVEEAKLVGKWEQLTIEGPLALNLLRDHTFVAIGGIAEGPMRGWWRVSRNQLILKFDNPLMPDTKSMSLTQFHRIYRRVDPPRNSNAIQRGGGANSDPSCLHASRSYSALDVLHPRFRSPSLTLFSLDGDADFETQRDTSSVGGDPIWFRTLHVHSTGSV